jgi:hypothetical protein
VILLCVFICKRPFLAYFVVLKIWFFYSFLMLKEELRSSQDFDIIVIGCVQDNQESIFWRSDGFLPSSLCLK